MSYLDFYWTVAVVVVVNHFIVMLNIKLQRQGHVVCLLFHFSSYLKSSHSQAHKPGGDGSLDSYGSSAAVNSVIVFGSRAGLTSLCVGV